MWRQIVTRAMYQARQYAAKIKIDANSIGVCVVCTCGDENERTKKVAKEKNTNKHVTANYDNELQNSMPDKWTCSILTAHHISSIDWHLCVTQNFPHSIRFHRFPLRYGRNKIVFFSLKLPHSFASNMANHHALNRVLRSLHFFLITFEAITTQWAHIQFFEWQRRLGCADYNCLKHENCHCKWWVCVCVRRTRSLCLMRKPVSWQAYSEMLDISECTSSIDYVLCSGCCRRTCDSTDSSHSSLIDQVQDEGNGQSFRFKFNRFQTKNRRRKI